jgi:hypothetical protein
MIRKLSCPVRREVARKRTCSTGTSPCGRPYPPRTRYHLRRGPLPGQDRQRASEHGHPAQPGHRYLSRQRPRQHRPRPPLPCPRLPSNTRPLRPMNRSRTNPDRSQTCRGPGQIPGDVRQVLAHGDLVGVEESADGRRIALQRVEAIRAAKLAILGDPSAAEPAAPLHVGPAAKDQPHGANGAPWVEDH